jgi:two-component system cell cycle sensor histidine kinase/response regulator CckA
MVYGIIRQSGGSIRVMSEPGRGTTFAVYLPRVAPEEPLEAPARPKRRPPKTDSLTVLVVEDDEAVRRSMTRMIDSLGHRVLSAGRGEEALEICRAGSEQADAASRVDLVVTDVVMEGMSGVELAQLLCARHPGIKVLFVSGYAEESLPSAEALPARFLFLAKPFSRDALQTKIKELFES